MAGDDPQTLPLLHGVSVLVVLASVCGAFGLHLWRGRNGRRTGRGQFFNDGGAIISLIILLSMLVEMIAPSPQLGELVRDNSILVFWAIGYAAVMVILNLVDSAAQAKGAR